MFSARAILQLLIDDEQPVPPDDPRQMGLDFNSDEIDPKAEIMRYAETPFRIPGDGPTSTYQFFQGKLAGARVREGQRRKKIQNNTYVIDYGNRLAVRYYQTDVVTAFPDGKVVVNTGGWHPGGHQINYGWRALPGASTLDRIGHMANTAGGWNIYKKNFVWYWFSGGGHVGDWRDTRRFPFTSGDTIFPDGSLQLQAEPEDVRRRRPRV